MEDYQSLYLSGGPCFNTKHMFLSWSFFDCYWRKRIVFSFLSKIMRYYILASQREVQLGDLSFFVGDHLERHQKDKIDLRPRIVDNMFFFASLEILLSKTYNKKLPPSRSVSYSVRFFSFDIRSGFETKSKIYGLETWVREILRRKRLRRKSCLLLMFVCSSLGYWLSSPTNCEDAIKS